MREKIAEWLHNRIMKERITGDIAWAMMPWADLAPSTQEAWYKEVSPILALICEEIEKMENPYPDTMAFRISHPAFEEFRQKILTIFKED